MKKSILSIAYTVALFGNAAVQAAGTSPFQGVAEEQARQSLAAARQLIQVELEQAMRLSAEAAEGGTGRAPGAGEVARRELPVESITAGK